MVAALRTMRPRPPACMTTTDALEWVPEHETQTLKSKDGRFQIREAHGPGSGPPVMLLDGTYMVGHYMESKNAKAEAERRRSST